MPIYDYECKDCKQQFEALVLARFDPPTCPKCNGANLEQQISTFMVDSTGTRESSMKVVKAKNDKLRRDYAHEQAAHEREHHH